MKTFYINANDAGQRLDKFVMKSVKTLPTSLIYKSIRTKKIKVNRKRAALDYRLCEGDTVEMFINNEFFDDKKDNLYLNMTPKLNVVYEDDNVIICDKLPGMLCHPDDNEYNNTLINHIQAHLYQKNEYDPEKENSFVPSLCNRIDRNTGGLVIAAKTAESLRYINEIIKNNKIVKKYLCAVHGKLEKKEDTLRGYLIKNQADNIVEIFNRKPSDENVKSIVTKYRVLDYGNDLSLLEVELITGRTHQIRAHMASIGHPLLGDGKYGVNREDRKLGYKYQALYSYYLKYDDIECIADKTNIWFLREFK